MLEQNTQTLCSINILRLSSIKVLFHGKEGRDQYFVMSLLPLVSRPRQERYKTLANFFRFPTFCDEAGKKNKQISPRPRLIDNQMELDQDKTQSLCASV